MTALCMFGAILAALLREEKQLFGILLVLAMVLLAVPLFFDAWEEIFTFFNRLLQLSVLPEELFAPMIKVLGIAAVTKIGTSICKDADSAAAQTLLEIGGTCCAFLAALPLMEQTLRVLEEML